MSTSKRSAVQRARTKLATVDVHMANFKEKIVQLSPPPASPPKEQRREVVRLKANVHKADASLFPKDYLCGAKTSRTVDSHCIF